MGFIFLHTGGQSVPRLGKSCVLRVHKEKSCFNLIWHEHVDFKLILNCSLMNNHMEQNPSSEVESHSVGQVPHLF